MLFIATNSLDTSVNYASHYRTSICRRLLTGKKKSRSSNTFWMYCVRLPWNGTVHNPTWQAFIMRQSFLHFAQNIIIHNSHWAQYTAHSMLQQYLLEHLQVSHTGRIPQPTPTPVASVAALDLQNDIRTFAYKVVEIIGVVHTYALAYSNHSCNGYFIIKLID